MGDYLYLIIGLAVLLLGGLAGLIATRGRSRHRDIGGTASTGTLEAPTEPRVGEDAETPRDTATRTVEDHALPTAAEAPPVERPESTASRLVRLRQRLARSQSPLGRGLLALLSRDVIDED
ncbi:MAG: signal recognition particle-docking protein FtsY, partial [Nocardioidaceae bacterium]